MMEDPPALRRINGFTWPFHIHQILSWLFLLAVMMNCFGILIPSFPFIHQIWLFPFGGILAILHIVFHCATVVIDPAIEQVRAKKTRETKIFRKTSGHFIVEEGYCNVCDVNLPEDLEDPHHCRRCNKCIEKMDHHCIYLNNCIGSRNYISFATCAITAFGFALFTALLSLALFIMFFLSYAEFKFFTLGIPSALWLIILVLGLIISFYIIYQVGRLLSFHLHLYLTKQTTLEFIRNSSDQFVDYSPYSALKEVIGCSKNIRPLCKTKSLVSIEPIEVNTHHAKYSRLCWKNKESPELEKMSAELCCKVTTRVKKINIKPSGGTRNSVSDDEPEEIVTCDKLSMRTTAS